MNSDLFHLKTFAWAKRHYWYEKKRNEVLNRSKELFFIFEISKDLRPPEVENFPRKKWFYLNLTTRKLKLNAKNKIVFLKISRFPNSKETSAYSFWATTVILIWKSGSKYSKRSKVIFFLIFDFSKSLWPPEVKISTKKIVWKKRGSSKTKVKSEKNSLYLCRTNISPTDHRNIEYLGRTVRLLVN